MERVSLVSLACTLWNDFDWGSQDIVDTVPYSGVHLTSEGLVKILAGAINRKVDNQTSK